MKSTRTNKKKKQLQKNEKAQSKENVDKRETETDENPLDFGGIPQRDIKKNLGCGR